MRSGGTSVEHIRGDQHVSLLKSDKRTYATAVGDLELGGDVANYRLLSVDALGYELINKRFRNPVLGHVRRRLDALFGDALDTEIQTLYKMEWEQITKSLEIAQAK